MSKPNFIPEILSTRKFKQKFMECLQRHPISLRVASPYIGEIPSFQDIIRFSQYFLREDGVAFQLITCPPVVVANGQYLTQLQAEIIVNLGVNLIVKGSPTLHSKIYHFSFQQGDCISFVGSSNFTKGGFQKNDETVAMFRDPVVNKKVEEELNRLSNYGSAPYLRWKADCARKTQGGINV